MKGLKGLGAITIIAALVLLPQAMAFSSGFGNAHVSTTTLMDLGIDSSFNSAETLSGNTLSGELEADTDEADWVNQFHSATSTDGRATVATYAYMSTPGTWSYKYDNSNTRTSATIWETVEATDATNVLFGGFAYNQKDYAAVQVWSWDDSVVGAINYRNDLFASNKEVKASQSLDAEGANLGMEAWSNRGNKKNEATDEDAILAIWNGEADPGSHPSPDSVYDLAVSQYASINAEKIESYSSSASLKSSKAEGSQSANVATADNAYLYSGSARGVPEILEIMDEEEEEDANWVYADTAVQVQGAESIAYSATSKSTSSGMTSGQTVDVQNAQYASKWANAGSRIGDNYYVGGSWGDIGSWNFYPPAVYAEEVSDEANGQLLGSMKGSDKAVSTKTSAKTTSDVNARATAMSKGAWANSGGEDVGYYANSNVIAGNRITEDVAEDAMGVQATMKGSDSSESKKNYASATSVQDVDNADYINTMTNAFASNGMSYYSADSWNGLQSYFSEADGAEILSFLTGSEKATAKKDYASVDSKLDSASAGFIERYSSAGSNNGELSYYAESYSNADSLFSEDGDILASMKGSNTVTSKKDYASATQKIDAKGASINRWIHAGLIGADVEGEENGVRASTSLFGGIYNGENYLEQVPAAASSLNGQSTATITSRGSSMAGSWKVYLAQDLTEYEYPEATFYRSVDAYNNLHAAWAGGSKTSIDGAKSFSFKESAKENAKDATAA